MHPIIILIIIAICFWSVFTTSKAIYLILTKDFTGDKPTWILTVMIGIIGPILWITRGKKLIVQK
ncbi:hypothetical protein EAX61_05285 [Dokdonia sinensis]|uniref:Cardiolipin synthase N-terminal domain-containing protein n=1 Tax=Dokdonia sinensis TaxID=2479847 RepID=A0A3M0G908_9FLAO|nr:hypothetical protein EAX61_05285 [Dokdonia sinensis]